MRPVIRSNVGTDSADSRTEPPARPWIVRFLAPVETLSEVKQSQIR